mmetsp:Transcript_7161/g.12032  ORF Transcript_7161/g.12032 Transcript_7161/m.12032 type:complete len:873 (-) Transcript_7161:575-3193(-)|eukprot:CAMPEP_0119341142 /NCGR_PEP_ID=MMETSP1333-20130426/101715_1 /TAXON_ID=418940 /ORGANISM="Scyphosphaera apsteinii, Strain RCC1455" /LENGTH=872 /DNA_ID=CAMNT_0007353039 /DNA_START=43 /DNA_END=2661 /DNA_ORIENTATION=-
MPPPENENGAASKVTAKFTDLCCNLQFSSALQTHGTSILHQLFTNKDKLAEEGSDFTNSQLAAVAYLASIRANGPPISIAQLVQNMAVSMKDFFYTVEEQQARLLPGGAQLPQLKQLKGQYVVSTVAYSKYEKFFTLLFPNGFVGQKENNLMEVSFEFGWMIFLVVKTLVLGSKDGELMSVYHLLICVLHFLVAHLPGDAQTSCEFWSQLERAVQPECYPLPSHARARLCQMLHAQYDEAAKLEASMPSVVEELKKTFGLSEPTARADDSDGGGGGVSGLFTPASLHENLRSITGRYEELWPKNSQLDERLFLAPAVPSRAVCASVPSSPCRVAHASVASPHRQLLTPLRGSNLCGLSTGGVTPVAHGTPVSSQVESVSWLRTAVFQLPSEPGPALHRYFVQCQPNPANAICERLQRLSRRVAQHLEESEMPEEVAERVDLARRLYFKMLLSFLEAEEKRLNQSNFSALLSNESFHCSLLACCMEAVFAAYSMSSMAFPAVLDILELRPFDFCKVIESFILHEPNLPHQLRQHFADVDSKILESLAWEDDSPLHALMQEYDVANGANGASLTSTPSGQTRAKAALEQFLRKVLYLAAARISEMCTRLLLPSGLVKQVWDCLKNVLNSARYLLLGRHLDQLIMCTVYGVCKVNQRAVTFRHIIEQYKRQPKATMKVFREVRMKEPGDQPQDIICFYNQIFIPAMKDQLMHICSGKGPIPAGSNTSPSSPFPDGVRCGASPQRVSGTREVYVSQPRTPSGTMMTPRTRTLYAFGDTPAEKSEKLLHINHQLNSSMATHDGVQALQQLSSTPPMRAPAPIDDGSRKRVLSSQHEGGGAKRHHLHRRLMQDTAAERCSSQGSNSSEAPGDANDHNS